MHGATIKNNYKFLHSKDIL